jgi:hypothetical protein
MYRKLNLALLAPLAAGIIAATTWSQPADEPGSDSTADEHRQKPRTRVTVAEDTTVVLGPLREDGYVDYIAALNQQCSEGVTPDDNAAVLICRAFGPSGIHEDCRERFFELLGIDPPPTEGPYVLTSDEFERQRMKEHASGEIEPAYSSEAPGGTVAEEADTEDPDTFSDELSAAMSRPWSREEFPDVARWLKRNRAPLRLVEQATQRPRYYSPMVTPSTGEMPGMVVSILLPVAQQCRESARLLAARAMFRLGEGKVDEAWRDLLACHRLARLVGDNPMLICALVATAIDAIACSGDAVVIQSGRLTAEDARKILADLQSLRPLPSVAEKIDTAERYQYLDIVCAVARGEESIFGLAGSGRSPKMLHRVFNAAFRLLIDWDLILRNGNFWFDRIVEALQKPSHIERLQALESFMDDVMAMEYEMRHPLKTARSFLLSSPRRAASERLSHVFSALLLPAVGAPRLVEGRATTQARLTEIGFALAAYRADNGSYPDSLAKLAPKYIAELPEDPFTGEHFRYQREGEGFVIHSLGPNMEDNGARVEHMDRDKAAPGEDTSQWDDYRLRIPVE